MAETLYSILLPAQFIASGCILLMLLFIAAPYGRYHRPGWGPALNPRPAWLAMESPAVFVILLMFLTGPGRERPWSWVFLMIWEIHYLQRAFIYPFLLPENRRRFPALLVFFGFVFNSVNGYINGWHLFHGAGIYTPEWFASWRFLLGATVFILGLGINIGSDAVLRNLKKRTGEGYAVPRGGLFDYVASPNYLGEMLEWTGWAVLTWSWAGLAFAVFTFANLFPRAVRNRRWYRENFPGYPQNRRILIPFIL